jgi:hypothetical protein
MVRFSASIEEIDQSAATLFAFVQSALCWMKENGYRSRNVLSQIRALQDLAFAVVMARSGSRRRAKQVQLEACAGNPLTVCVGELGLKRLSDLRDVLDPHGEYEEHVIPIIDWQAAGGSGCFAICADGEGLQRPSTPRKWCEKCRKASSSRTARRIKEIVQIWGERRCAVCGASFMPTRVDRWRCDRCLAGRRSRSRKHRIAQRSS